MEPQYQAIEQLRSAVERAVGRKMLTNKDFDCLADSIYEKLHAKISTTTLKRIWGYVSEGVNPRRYTLDQLSQYVGYADFDAFCISLEANKEPESNPSTTETGASPRSQEGAAPGTPLPTGKGSRVRVFLAAVALLLVAGGLWLAYGHKSDSSHYLLVQGQKFATYQDYLKLFGIHDTITYWGRVLPRHPNIVVWGPEYHHPHWQNEGDRSQLMPTITEHWAPADADIEMINMRNRDKYNHELRNNEVRITFMKGLTDQGYVFLGVYRLSLSQSDTTRCVWERVADECDLANLDYLEELRN